MKDVKRILSIFVSIVLLFNPIFATASSDTQAISNKDFSNGLYSMIEEYDSSSNGTGASVVTTYTNRIIVKTNSNKSIDSHGAIASVEGFNNWHIFQYATATKAGEALSYYREQSFVEYAEADKIVQHFDISKEDFERATLESAKVLYDPNSPPPSMNPKDYINQEMFELYNADIIYTFDDDIINEYYLSGDYPFVYESDYKAAVASDNYTSRTEYWADIDQMEADIIAKYGEADTPAAITEEFTEEKNIQSESIE